MIDVNGQHLRASRIRVWCPKLLWFNDSTTASLQTSPLGDNRISGSDFNYPRMPEFGVVLFQSGLVVESIRGPDDTQALEIELSPAVDILVNVNDIVGGYPNNTGTFDLSFEVLAP
jgi:hypothetical protein